MNIKNFGFEAKIFGSVSKDKVDYFVAKSQMMVQFCEEMHTESESDNKLHFKVEDGILTPVGKVRIKNSQKEWIVRAAEYLKKQKAEIFVVIAHVEKGAIYAKIV